MFFPNVIATLPILDENKRLSKSSMGIFLTLLLTPNLWSQNLATYNLFPMGAERSMAMGGAFTAVSDDVSGLRYNPAGPVWGESFLEFSLIQNRMSNGETDLYDDFVQASDFWAGGLILRFKNWALGVGVSTPYDLKLETYPYEGSFRIYSGDLAISYKYNNNLSVGAAYRYHTLNSEYRDSSLSASESAVSNSGSAGVIFEKGKVKFGATWHSGYLFKFSDGANDDLGGEIFFRDAEVPSRLSLGLALQAKKDVLVVIDHDTFYKIDPAIIPGSSASAFGPQEDVKTEGQSYLHGGFEWYLVRSKGSDIALRWGIYRPPEKSLTGENRLHLTYGLEVRFGPAVLRVSVDQASDFSSSAQGFSLSFGHI